MHLDIRNLTRIQFEALIEVLISTNPTLYAKNNRCFLYYLHAFVKDKFFRAPWSPET